MRQDTNHSPTTTGIAAGHPANLAGHGAPGELGAIPTAGMASGDAASVMARAAELIEAGKVRAARRAVADVLAAADPATAALLGHCLAALESAEPTRTERLRWLWRNCDDDGRALVEACAPRRDTHPLPPLPAIDAEPARAPRWSADTLHQAPRDLATRRLPTGQRPQPRTPAQARAGDLRETDAYLAERAPLGEQDARSPEQDDYEQLDYDRAAVPALRGTACVVCFVERATRDQHRRPDDGLCEDCRDAARPGIAPLPAGHTRAEAIAARCAHLARLATTPEQAAALLRAEWRRADPAARGVIAGWVTTHTSP
jgi:hypothetical protein